MTVKERRVVRRRRQRVLLDPYGRWVPAKQLTRRDPVGAPASRWPMRENRRENARRLRQIERGELRAER